MGLPHVRNPQSGAGPLGGEIRRCALKPKRLTHLVIDSRCLAWLFESSASSTWNVLRSPRKRLSTDHGLPWPARPIAWSLHLKLEGLLRRVRGEIVLADPVFADDYRIK